MGKSELGKDYVTIELIICTLEKRTGMKLAGLTQKELNAKLSEWMKANPDA